MAPTLFISGAAGHLGRRVVELLRERGYAGRIIAGTRTPEAVDFPGVETRHADFNDLPGLVQALAGVDTMLLISLDVLGDNRRRLQVQAVEAAKQAGVKHIVYTSMVNPEPPSDITFAPEHYGTEQAIVASGIPYTILRNMWYAENLLGSLPPALASGKLYTAAGAGRQAYVSREDCARAAAGALLSAHDQSRVLNVTGDAALTMREIAAAATAVTGKPIEVVDVTEEQLAAGARAAGVPDEVIETFIVPFDRNTRSGKVDVASDAVKQLWGTKPQSVRDFLTQHRAALGA